MTGRVDSIQHLVALSQSILAKAEEQEWEEVIALEAERSQLFRLFFQEPVQVDDVDLVAAGIKEIMAIDRNIMDLGILKKLDLADTLHTMEQGKKAVKAYGDSY